MPGNTPQNISFHCSCTCHALVILPLIITLLLLPCLLSPVFARQEAPEYYETSVFLVVEGIGGTEMPAVISNELAYLSLNDVFDFLKIKNSLSPGADTVSGFFITQAAVFMIDNTHHRIEFQGKVFELQPDDLIRTTTNLYMKTTVFSSVFGLDCKFNFRSLSVNMTTKLELPAIREMRQEMMHRNISRLKGQIKADTVIGRYHPLFQFGMADWSLIATQRTEGGNDTRMNLSLGGTVAGGETTVSLNYNGYSRQDLPVNLDSNSSIVRPFDQRQQFYRWRYVNNDNKWLRQVIAGTLFTQSIASIYDPVVGVQFTNTSTAYRRSFGTYTLSDFTDPGWTVELYVNNELINYATADASGFFTFQVPLVYGNSLVKLRFYSPWGEERTREENISIPFNFLPQREFEYTASAGIVEDSSNSRFARVSLNYGATKHLTVGGGVEYLSSVTTGQNMPFVNASLRITSNLLVSGDYTYGVRARGIINYRLPSNLQIDLNYTRYKKGQKAINYNYLEERKIMVSRPFVGRHFAVFSRLTIDQMVLPGTNYTTGEWLMSGALLGVGANLTTYAVLTDDVAPYFYSNLALTFRLPGRLMVTPQVQYEYNKNRVMATRCELGKYLFHHGYMDVTYERNFKSDFNNIGIGFRYDFSFSQVGLSAWNSNNVTTLIQSARGSLIYDGKSRQLDINNRTSVGTGGVIILAFLDLNNNGHRDAGEPKVSGLQIAANGGRIVVSKRDTTIRILELEPYSHFFIDMSRNNFESVSWQIKHQTVSVVIEPNLVKLIEVPVAVMGEVSGTVYLKEKNKQMGLSRITLIIYRQDESVAARIQSEEDGFFSYMGLAPGNYTARVDTVQLHTLGMTSLPAVKPFHIAKSMEGDIVDGMEFILQRSTEGENTK